MSNEKKILLTLETIVDKIGNLEQGQARLEHEVKGLKTEITEIKSYVGTLKSDVAEIKHDLIELTVRVDDLTMKVEKIDSKLDAVAALQVDDYTSLSTLEKKVGDLSNVTTVHERRFIKMKEAI